MKKIKSTPNTKKITLPEYYSVNHHSGMSGEYLYMVDYCNTYNDSYYLDSILTIKKDLIKTARSVAKALNGKVDLEVTNGDIKIGACKTDSGTKVYFYVYVYTTMEEKEVRKCIKQ